MTQSWGRVAVAGVLLALSSSVGADRNKQWEGDDGVPAYGDSVPPEAVQRGYRELDEQGIERETIAPAPTEEVLEQQRQTAALRDEVARLRREQEAKDQRLIDRYPTQEDLLRACEGNMYRLDEQIRQLQVDLGRLRSSLTGLQALAAEAERSGRQPSSSVQADIANVESRITTAQSSVQMKQGEKLAVDKRCQVDLKRYRELRPESSAVPESDAVTKPHAGSPVETEVRCVSEAECQRLWEIAQEYAQRYSTMPVDLKASRIWASASPSDARDVGITVARLAGNDGSEERIVMDVQCATTSDGKAFCLGPEVSAIRRNFRDALSKGSLELR